MSGEPETLEDVDLPRPREASVESVEAVREYVHETGGATGVEIVEALEPEENHRVGLAAAQLLGKFTLPEFYREWWWDNVVAPGLRALPGVAPPDDESPLWRPADGEGTLGDDGTADTEAREGESASFDSPRAVQDVLEGGQLFELAYETDGDERRVTVSAEGRIRPSTLPVDDPPGFRFHAVATEETYEVLLPELVDLVPVSLERVPEPLRPNALAAVANAVANDPTSVELADAEVALEAARRGTVDPRVGLELAGGAIRGDPTAFETVADDVFALLDAESCDAGERALSETRTVANAEPEAVAEYVPQIADLLEDPQYGTDAAACLATLAESDTAAVLDTVPALAAAAQSGANEGYRWIVYAFSKIAGEYPEELFPTLDVLVEGVREEDETTRQNALSAIGRIAGAYPDAAEDVAEDVAALLEADDPAVRANAVGLLGDLAEGHPSAVMDHGETIVGLLVDPDEDVRHNASITLLRAGEAAPEVIRQHPEELESALDDADPEVRANACSLIGNTGAAVSIDELRSLAEDDPDETVRDRAAWAAERLS